MSTNEVLLMIVFFAVLFFSVYMMQKAKQPLKTYISLAGGLLLLVLVWFFADENASIYIKGLMTVLVVFSAIKNIKEYLNFKRQLNELDRK